MTLVLYVERPNDDGSTDVIFSSDLTYSVGGIVYSKQDKIKQTRRFLYSGTGPIGSDVIVEDLEEYVKEELSDESPLNLRELYLFTESFSKIFPKYTSNGVTSGTIIVVDKFFPTSKFMIYLSAEKGFQIDFLTDSIIAEGSAFTEGKAVLLTLLRQYSNSEPLENIVFNTYKIVNEINPIISSESQIIKYVISDRNSIEETKKNVQKKNKKRTKKTIEKTS